jgi:hypothetical protein
MKSVQSRLTREELEVEFRACLAFAIAAILTLYSVLSL